jgi:hypothetical protein
MTLLMRTQWPGRSKASCASKEDSRRRFQTRTPPLLLHRRGWPEILPLTPTMRSTILNARAALLLSISSARLARGRCRSHFSASHVTSAMWRRGQRSGGRVQEEGARRGGGGGLAAVRAAAESLGRVDRWRRPRKRQQDQDRPQSS